MTSTSKLRKSIRIQKQIKKKPREYPEILFNELRFPSLTYEKDPAFETDTASNKMQLKSVDWAPRGPTQLTTNDGISYAVDVEYYDVQGKYDCDIQVLFDDLRRKNVLDIRFYRWLNESMHVYNQYELDWPHFREWRNWFTNKNTNPNAIAIPVSVGSVVCLDGDYVHVEHVCDVNDRTFWPGYEDIHIDFYGRQIDIGGDIVAMFEKSNNNNNSSNVETKLLYLGSATDRVFFNASEVDEVVLEAVRIANPYSIRFAIMKHVNKVLTEDYEIDTDPQNLELFQSFFLQIQQKFFKYLPAKKQRRILHSTTLTKSQIKYFKKRLKRKKVKHSKQRDHYIYLPSAEDLHDIVGHHNKHKTETYFASTYNRNENNDSDGEEQEVVVTAKQLRLYVSRYFPYSVKCTSIVCSHDAKQDIVINDGEQ